MNSRLGRDRIDDPKAQRNFWRKVDTSGECWLWTAATTNGYGKFNGWRAHRWAYVTAYGDIPDGLVLDHLCRNRACVRPDHLEAVTIRTNILRGESMTRNLSKTHCHKGHEYSETNTVMGPHNDRRCRTCRNAYGKKAMAPVA